MTSDASPRIGASKKTEGTPTGHSDPLLAPGRLGGTPEFLSASHEKGPLAVTTRSP